MVIRQAHLKYSWRCRKVLKDSLYKDFELDRGLAGEAILSGLPPCLYTTISRKAFQSRLLRVFALFLYMDKKNVLTIL